MAQMEQTIPGGRDVSGFTLKVLAIVAMTCDHTALIFADVLPFWALCLLSSGGGLVFPIMAFMLNEGYRHTRSVKRYALRLFLFACVAQVPYWLYLGHLGNILFTLLLGLGLLYLDDHMDNRPLFWLIACAAALCSIVLDWGVIGIALILMFRHLEGRERVVKPLLFVMAVLVISVLLNMASGAGLSALPDLLYAVVGTGLCIPLLLGYHGRRGYSLKYLFYIYYPLHILVLGLIATNLL